MVIDGSQMPWILGFFDITGFESDRTIPVAVSRREENTRPISSGVLFLMSTSLVEPSAAKHRELHQHA